VVAAHIHRGAAGENGPIVAFQAGPIAPGGGRHDGIPGEGTITAANLIGPLDEFVWTHFNAALANGRPDNLHQLLTTLCRLTAKVRRRPALIRSFVAAADLPAFL
jgi:hypothetical protein